MKHLSTGPELPYGLDGSAMATTPDGNGVILVGGKSSSTSFLDSILELKADGQGWVGTWTTLTTKLQYARREHIVIPVLMEKDICGLDGIVSTTTGKYLSQSAMCKPFEQATRNKLPQIMMKNDSISISGS